jgi:hypothetical protein
MPRSTKPKVGRPEDEDDDGVAHTAMITLNWRFSENKHSSPISAKHQTEGGEWGARCPCRAG